MNREHERLGGPALERDAVVDPRVVYERVRRANASDDLVGRRAARARLHEVARHEPTPTDPHRQLVVKPPAGVFILVHDHRCGPLSGERAHDGFANSFGATGHNHCPSNESEVHLKPPR